ncbi:quinate 5-dehydrogenase [Iocasia frigidifontis]|uniref:Quinate 5-dehydrogenase n=1 Tax=Iocasia fonsfrigidae TaxID=2682810 RepID=A0A8A7KNC7_9FIRM|nr:quinate 5-dehydrogenase [Iocasia fonsfrigidae]QTL99352.1 quinate 5-dehydrogenase [Iocasia fonsfrigidae]
MKKVISISLGSSKRDHRVEVNILGEKFIIERRGTNGDKKKAARLFTELDGKYDAFGIGGIDLYIYSGKKRYTFRDAKKLIKDVKQTPAVDGSGLKNTLERRVVAFLDQKTGLKLANKKVLMVSAVDRFGMAEALVSLGAEVIFGDLIFALGLPMPIYSLKTLDKIARTFAPVITKLPIEWVYPTGNNQDKKYTDEKYTRYYQEADVIAGDYHFVRKYMPQDMNGKIIITNTVTQENISELEKSGIKTLITTTPELNGRSFGTNVMEGVLITLAGKKPGELSSDDYLKLLDKIGFSPRVIEFDRQAVS